ncbi:hypothetical protein IAE22_28455, partial [Bacillus sp. S34]|nr:hypothetical protein [Bacillus sp. S34]
MASFPVDHPFVADAAFVVAEATARGLSPKFTIPAPTVFDFRLDADQIRTDHYDGRDAIAEDLVQAYRDAIAALYAAGVRYLQLDDTAWAYACSDAEMAKARERGIETDGIAERFSSIIRRVLDGRPEDLVVTTHDGTTTNVNEVPAPLTRTQWTALTVAALRTTLETDAARFTTPGRRDATAYVRSTAGAGVSVTTERPAPVPVHAAASGRRSSHSRERADRTRSPTSTEAQIAPGAATIAPAAAKMAPSASWS